MVHPHGGDDRGLRHADDIGGVQCTAQAHLQHGDVTAFPAEVQQGYGGNQLKFRRVLRHGRRSGADLLHQRRQLIIGDHLPVHPDTLMKGHEIGRGVQSDPVPGGPEHGGDAGAGAALAVGARHMNKFLFCLGGPQGAEQRPDAVQPGGTALPLVRVNICNGLLSGHGVSSYARASPWRRSSTAMGRAAVATITAISTPEPRRYSSSPKT